jgi:hypothetical protein
MSVRNYNHGKFFGPVQIYMGYVFIASGIFCAFYALTALLLIIPGAFMSFTYTGTLLDIDNRKVKSYTTLFGLFMTGNWISIDQFTRFNIQRATRNYTSYSRGSVKFDMNISDIKLILTNRNGSKKVVLNRYSSFEGAQREKEDLGRILFPSATDEQIE